MIRRSYIDDRGTPSWLLISQVAHARISGELAQYWTESFSSEVIQAITHHDDGWAKWEASPQLDPVRGRPLSFLEMPVADAMSIWNDSIQSARHIGPLSGAIVAGHFIGLVGGSEYATKSPVKEWVRSMADTRVTWIGEWRRSNSLHTPEIAACAQAMLLAADLLSLWLCCDGPVIAVESTSVPTAEMEARAAKVLGKYRFDAFSKSIGASSVDWEGSVSPWPLAAESLELQAPAVAVPAVHFASWAEIAANARPMLLRWQLRQTLPTSDECR